MEQVTRRTKPDGRRRLKAEGVLGWREEAEKDEVEDNKDTSRRCGEGDLGTYPNQEPQRHKHGW